MRLDGKVVLVTGAARGIGRAIAQRCARCGADVAIADVLEDAMADVAKAIEGEGRRALTVKVDVIRRADVDAMVTRVVDEFARIDILFNNAGIIEIQPFLEVDKDHWDRVMAVNAKGAFLCAQAAARHMVNQGAGRIINTASVASRVGLPDMAPYAASKAAVMSLTRTMALDLGPRGVTVNAIAPGIVDTDMWDKIDAERAALSGVERGEPIRERVANIPIGRAATAGDVASVAVFLASDEAGYVNGQTLNIDGGSVPS